MLRVNSHHNNTTLNSAGKNNNKLTYALATSAETASEHGNT